MSKLNIDQKTVLALFTDKRSDFLIPDYQRPYAWDEDQCATLWDDVFSFAIPDGNADNFSDNDEYFLGPIVTFRNSTGQLEIIDGQQRLTTLMLMLRAFYAKFEHMQDEQSISTRDRIAGCIWKTDEFSRPNREQLKIDSEVASDSDKEEFLSILKSGKVEADEKSRYAEAFSFFKGRIDEFVDKYPTYTPYLATRVLNNVILLPIEAESQSTALRIFSTLNDRGLPLSDADIFKSQFYKFYSDKNEKDVFIERWRRLEEVSERVFSRARSNPMDELFTRYMYYERAKLGIRDTTTGGLRDFFERDSYALLKSEETLDNLESLLGFWECVANQDEFSDRVLRRLFVLNYAPNGMWTYFVSVYFLHRRDSDGKLEESAFYDFLAMITGFIWAYAVDRPGVNALRTPIYPEMVHLVRDEAIGFESYKFSRRQIEEQFRNYQFTNGRPITKSMLVWWAFQDDQQQLIDLDVKIETEHIFARKRAEVEGSLNSRDSLEALGNKAFLEKKINIRASDYRFEDKKKYYAGYTTSRGQARYGTGNNELRVIAAEKNDFSESDIEARTAKIIEGFISYLDKWNLFKNESN